jgi:hypothetical protein
LIFTHPKRKRLTAQVRLGLVGIGPVVAAPDRLARQQAPRRGFELLETRLGKIPTIGNRGKRSLPSRVHLLDLKNHPDG